MIGLIEEVKHGVNVHGCSVYLKIAPSVKNISVGDCLWFLLSVK